GEMVSLSAVEELITECWPEQLHAVVSFSHPAKGEQLVLLTTQPEANRKKIMLLAQEKGLSEIQVPRVIFTIEEVPLMGTGKINYPEVHLIARRLMHGSDTDNTHSKIVNHDDLLTKTGGHAAHGC
ncbi:MAG: hypothetical protein Q9M09_06020, partial [Mariprofundaceae bacterium]|nr:hypothetical protein [Mariprofundaceae bacterium]